LATGGTGRSTDATSGTLVGAIRPTPTAAGAADERPAPESAAGEVRRRVAFVACMELFLVASLRRDRDSHAETTSP
jgi:hypothetical protein